MVMLLIGSAFFACSDDKDTGSQKGKIETMTHEVAEKAVKQIRSPINKARSVQGLQDEHTRDLKKTVEE